MHCNNSVLYSIPARPNRQRRFVLRLLSLPQGDRARGIREVLQIPSTTTTTIRGYQVDLACS